MITCRTTERESQFGWGHDLSDEGRSLLNLRRLDFHLKINQVFLRIFSHSLFITAEIREGDEGLLFALSHILACG